MTATSFPFRTLPLLLAVVVLAACGGPAPLPTPRPLVIHSGARLNADPERMEEVDAFVRRTMDSIERDPSFLIRIVVQDSTALMWEGLRINEAADTASIQVQRGQVDAHTPYQIYAHLHLMARRGRIGDWIPNASTLEGYELERAILARIADVWLYGRAIYDAAPYLPLDQLLWASEAGFLDAYILTARSEEFAEAHRDWLARDEGAVDRYREWFRETFSANPPGWRAAGN